MVNKRKRKIDFNQIPFDLDDVSKIDKNIWSPSEDDKRYMGQNAWDEAKEEAEKLKSELYFNNVSVVTDSCDCEFGCSHKSWVIELIVTNGEEKIVINVEDDALIVFPWRGTDLTALLSNKFTYRDFIDLCKFCEIKLESQYVI